MWDWAVGLLEEFFYWLVKGLWEIAAGVCAWVRDMAMWAFDCVYQYASDLVWRTINALLVWADGNAVVNTVWATLMDLADMSHVAIASVFPVWDFANRWFGVGTCLAILGTYYAALACFIVIKNILRFIPTMG